MKRGASSSQAQGADDAKRKKAEHLLSVEAVSALRHKSDPFVPGGDPVVTDEMLLAAVAIAATNPNLEQFGVDGTGCELGPDAASAIGGLAVRALVFPFVLDFTAVGCDAFGHALGANSALETIRLGSSNLDGESSGAWTLEGSAFVATVQRQREQRGLPPLVVECFEQGPNNDESEEEGEEEGEEQDDCVQCDRKGCRREIRGRDEVVYSSSMGLDYCTHCATTFSEERQAALRKTTVSARIAEG